MDMPVKRSIGVIALTGGPGGGKSELLRAIREDGQLGARVAVCEEAIHGMRFVRLSPRSAEFQCALVAIQAATGESLCHALADTDYRMIITHRGTLDPCAFWQSFGNSSASFFQMTGTTQEDHYRRYDLVVHLESAAVRVPESYTRYPKTHRPEGVQHAARLDHLLAGLWRGHPKYVKIDGTPEIEDKLRRAIGIMRRHLGC